MKFNRWFPQGFLMVISQLCYCQRDKFFVDIVEYDAPDFSTSLILCPAIVITSRHVLALASCVTQVTHSIGVRKSPAAIMPQSNDIVFYKTANVSIHPEFSRNHYWNNNVAVIEIDGAFNVFETSPKSIGSLQSNTTCNVMSLGGLLTVPLPIYDSQFCDMSLPQVYCSVFNFTDAQLCSAIFGEPVVCEDPTVVNGIVLSLSCNFTLGDIFQGSLNYHSLCDFNEWIRQVSAARKTKMSVIIFAFAGLLTLKNKI